LSGWFNSIEVQSPLLILKTWLVEEDIRRFLDVNRYKDVLWFNKEAFEEFSWWLLALAAVQTASEPQIDANRFVEKLVQTNQFIQTLLDAKEKSGYQIAGLIKALEEKKLEN